MNGSAAKANGEVHVTLVAPLSDDLEDRRKELEDVISWSGIAPADAARAREQLETVRELRVTVLHEVPQHPGPYDLEVEVSGAVVEMRTELSGGARVAVVVRNNDGVAECEAITLRPGPDDRLLPSSRTAARALPADLRQQLERVLEEPLLRRWLGRDWTEVMVPRRTGRAGTSDTVYAVWARRYVDALERHPRGPVQHMAEKYSLNRGSVSQYLDRARRRGLLTRPGEGRAGGALTPKALELLKGIPAEEDD